MTDDEFNKTLSDGFSEVMQRYSKGAVPKCISASKKSTLNQKEWVTLREKIQENRAKLTGLPIAEVVRFLDGEKVKCNANLLRGLMTDLHVWAQEKSQSA